MGKATRWLRGLFGGKKPDLDAPAVSEKRRQWSFVVPFREKAQQKQRRAGRAAAAAGAEERHGFYGGAFVAAQGEEEQRKRRVAASATFSKEEEAAASKIQVAFRGYLARRALKALRGLVKLQALVRGNIVRKQAAEALRCMQALVRVQARARAHRVLRPEQPHRLEKVPRRHARTSSRPATSDSAIRDRINSAGSNWLDEWMEERYCNSHGSVDAYKNDDKNAKVLEVDPGKEQLHQSSCSTLTSDQNSISFLTAISGQSPVIETHQSLRRLRLPFKFHDYGESPQCYYSASSRPGSSRRGALAPSKSDCSRSLFSCYSDYPNYMANTESSKAKMRSCSAPKQRPEVQNKDYSGSSKLDRSRKPIRASLNQT